MSSAVQVKQPNLFNLEGVGVSVSYSTSSIAGVPRFTYRDGSHTVDRSGDEIRTLGVEIAGIGTLVTVDIEHVPDLRTVTFTLLLPTINLPQEAEASTFQTVGVLTTHHTTIGGPGLIAGQVQTYQVLSLCGTAQHVVF